MDDRKPLGAPRRALASFALVCFTLGVATAAWHAPEGASTTVAGLFGDPVIDLLLEGEHGVDGFLSHRILEPGSQAEGTLTLSTGPNADRSILDLDFDVRNELDGGGTRRLDDSLYLLHLSYGRDDLLTGSDGGRDLVREIDANPVLGNGDGRLNLRELQAGANDLPPPHHEADGGTPFRVRVSFEPPAEAHSRDYRGQTLDVHFVFRLGDSMDNDLN